MPRQAGGHLGYSLLCRQVMFVQAAALDDAGVEHITSLLRSSLYTGRLHGPAGPW